MRMSIALTVAGTLAGAALGFLLTGGDPAGLIVGAPGLAVGIVQAWKADRSRAYLRGRIDELRSNVPVTHLEKRVADDERRRRDVSAQIAYGRNRDEY